MKPDRITFIRDSIEHAAQFIKQDPTGRMMMMRFADLMTRSSKRTFFNEGVLTANDTFMAYSKCLEESMKGNIE